MLTLTGEWRLQFGSKKTDEEFVLQGLAAPVSDGIQAIRDKNLTVPRMKWALCFLETSESE
jgi:hypothetical protein